MINLNKKIDIFYNKKIKPLRTKNISKMSDVEPWITIKNYYKSDDQLNRMVASLFNSLYTENLPCFMLSKSIMEEILRVDKNIERKSLNSSEYKQFVLYITSDPAICKCLSHPSEFGKGKRIAGLYRVIDEEARNYFFSVDNREQSIIETYCEMQKIKRFVVDKL